MLTETKQKIIQAARNLFARYGYHYPSIHHITKNIGLNKANFYGHFPTKESLAVYLVVNLTRECQEKIFNFIEDDIQCFDSKLNVVMQATNTFFKTESDVNFLMRLAFESNHDDTPQLKAAIDQHFKTWDKSLQKLFKMVRNPEQAKHLANLALLQLQNHLSAYCLFPEQGFKPVDFKSTKLQNELFL